MYLESNSRFVLFSSNDFLHFPLFFDDFSSWGRGGWTNQPPCNFEKTYQKLPKNRGEGIQKELSDNDVVDIFIFATPRFSLHFFWVIIYFWFNQLKLNFMCHTKTVFSSHFFRFIAWLSECMKNVDVLIYYMMYYKWIFAMYILCKVLL